MTMNKITAADPETLSEDIVAGNIEQLKAILPEAFTEGKIDFDVLHQMLGGMVEEREEKYGLNWFGKRRARQLALTPSTGTLRPCPEDSLNWDSTQNIMIEGDNLEVLKLLQKSYAGKVKLIYIDPPYNTGKDFVYQDDYQNSIKSYLALTGQIEDGKKLSSNTETSGRFHSDWLSMMYPRLKLARNLLSDDGIIFVSIDDNEASNLKKLLEELFGEENFAAQFIVKSNPRGSQSNAFSANVHEYILCFLKDSQIANPMKISLNDEMRDEYNFEDSKGKYRLLGLRLRGGSWRREQRPLLYFPIYIDPKTGTVSTVRTKDHIEQVLPIKPSTGEEGTWRWSQSKVNTDIDQLIAKKVSRDGDEVWDIFQKDYLTTGEGDQRGTKAKTIWDEKEFNYQNGTTELKTLFDEKIVFDFPKPVALIKRIIELAADDQALVLDFFAGSCTTAQATLELNEEDGGTRRFITVQLPESCAETSGAFKTGYKNIADIGFERIRRVSKMIKARNPLFTGDLGFRVCKLDTSNIQAWDVDRSNLPMTLESAVQHLKTDRTEADILYELLLKLGLDLCVPIETRTIADKTVHSIGNGVLFVCLAEQIIREEAEPLALGMVGWLKELAPAGDTTCVFRDSGFADDVVKSNLAAILEQSGLKNIRSI